MEKQTMNANNLFLAVIYMEHYLGTKEENEEKRERERFIIFEKFETKLHCLIGKKCSYLKLINADSQLETPHQHHRIQQECLLSGATLQDKVVRILELRDRK